MGGGEAMPFENGRWNNIYFSDHFARILSSVFDNMTHVVMESMRLVS